MLTQKENLDKRIFYYRKLLIALKLLFQRKFGTKLRTELLYEQARLMIGRDASPLDFVGDELGCAESVTQILKKVTPFPIITGTWTLWDRLKRDTRFVAVHGRPERGTIIIAPTGTGNGSMRGHVGILADEGKIMSATSADGIWRQNYNLDTWTDRYFRRGGFPVFLFKLI